MNISLAILRVTFLCLIASCALGAAPEERQEGELKKFINPDSQDVSTVVEVLRHGLYSVEQQLTAVTFRQLYGDEIEMEAIRYPVGLELIPGYIFRSKEPGSERRAPGIVLVHGGYHSSLTKEFFPFIARAVAEGFVVIFPEYRGSRGYGAEHYRALNYGGEEVEDVVAAGHHLAAKEYVDKDRVAIVGRSKGGMLALLSIQHDPDFFQAAVHVVGLVDFVAYMAYKPEYRRQDVARHKNFEGKMPFENLPAYIDVSPITHVDKIKTPLLILATTHDEIVPLELHTQRLIDALTARKKVFESKIYERAPGGHSFAHGDTPEARDAENRIFSFLAKYLK